MEKIIYLECIIATAIRYWLFESDHNVILANRIEVSTPLNSWKRGITKFYYKLRIYLKIRRFIYDLCYICITVLFIKKVFYKNVHTFYIIFRFTVLEGVVLYNEGTNPYVGDMFHETPLILWFFTWIIEHFSIKFINLLFIICDIITSFVLHQTAEMYLQQLVQNKCFHF